MGGDKRRLACGHRELIDDVLVRTAVRLVGADIRNAEDALESLQEIRLLEHILRLLRAAVRESDDADALFRQPIESRGIIVRFDLAEASENVLRSRDLQPELGERRLQRRPCDLPERPELAHRRQRQRAVQRAFEPRFERRRGRTDIGQLRPHGIEAEEGSEHIENDDTFLRSCRPAGQMRRIDSPVQAGAEPLLPARASNLPSANNH